MFITVLKKFCYLGCISGMLQNGGYWGSSPYVFCLWSIFTFILPFRIMKIDSGVPNIIGLFFTTLCWFQIKINGWFFSTLQLSVLQTFNFSALMQTGMSLYRASSQLISLSERDTVCLSNLSTKKKEIKFPVKEIIIINLLFCRSW